MRRVGEAEACWVDLWAAAVLVLPRREKPLLVLPLEKPLLVLPLEKPLLVLPLEKAPSGSAAGPR